jgi:hypothetical protein
MTGSHDEAGTNNRLQRAIRSVARRRTGASDDMTSCPMCSSQLEAIEVAPCFDCGHVAAELEECANGEHEYHVFSIWGQEIVLCDFCDADFGSYFPDFWGLPAGPLPDYPLELVRPVDRPEISKDQYCAACKHRLAFLLFRRRAIDHNAARQFVGAGAASRPGSTQAFGDGGLHAVPRP